MSQKLPVNGFKWIKYTSKFNENFIKNYYEENDKDIYLKQMLNILKGFKIFTIIYRFYQKEWKL